MTTPRDALRQMEAGYDPNTPADPYVRNDFRQREIEELNAAAAEDNGRKLVTWGAVGLLLLLVFSSRSK